MHYMLFSHVSYHKQPVDVKKNLQTKTNQFTIMVYKYQWMRNIVIISLPSLCPLRLLKFGEILHKFRGFLTQRQALKPKHNTA